jgi:hypothetical protein
MFWYYVVAAVGAFAVMAYLSYLADKDGIAQELKEKEHKKEEHKKEEYRKSKEYLDKILGGAHSLKALANKVIKEDTVSGHAEYHSAFFLACGGGDGEANITRSSKEYDTVRFFWQTNGERKEYVFSSLPLKKIRITFSEEQEVPTIEFVTKDIFRIDKTEDDVGYLLANYVKHAIITVRESDWKPVFELPMSESK